MGQPCKSRLVLTAFKKDRSPTLRVLLVLNAFEEDGPGLLLLNLCTLWVKNPALSLRVVALSRGGSLQKRFEEIGISTELYNTRTPTGFLSFGRSLKRLQRKGIPPDIIHTNLLWPDLICRTFRRFVPGARLVSTCHGLHAAGEKSRLGALIYGFVERQTRSRCNGWVAVSRFVANGLLAEGYPKSALHEIPNGIDCARFSPAPEQARARFRKAVGVEPGEPLLLAVGNFKPVKNHALLLESMVHVKTTFPGVRLMLVGSGPLKRHYTKMIRERGLEGTVSLHSPKQKALPLMMSAADLLVHCSHTESFGLVVAESLACETPVVATAVGALPELVIPGKTGELAEPDRILSLSSAICGLLVDPERRRSLGQGGRKHVLNSFRIEQTAERYLKFWREILKTP